MNIPSSRLWEWHGAESSLQRATAADDRPSDPLYVCGDVNMQMDEPRDEREAIDAQSMEMLLSRWGSARIAGIGRTRLSWGGRQAAVK